ncbi:N-acetylmuramoyl-L-alanine amidase-like domain-containing protein [Nocardia nepalensis]|uniref:N-acetylmuramoyl-L-alanine amidase-like domain-containing protein n=1 Tax=Nocardia nepalensis TaxID=3375448 RepID=UPI003B67ABBF
MTKYLNAKADGGQYLPCLPVVDRPMTYIPAAAVDDAVAGQLRTGDYIDAYTDPSGLDVTHVGICVQTPNGPVFHNASSLAANDKVVDSPFFEYARTVPA